MRPILAGEKPGKRGRGAEGKALVLLAGTISGVSTGGGSALPDGVRMVAVLQRWSEDNKLPLPPTLNPNKAIVMVLARAKGSYYEPQPLIWLTRKGYRFEDTP